MCTNNKFIYLFKAMQLSEGDFSIVGMARSTSATIRLSSRLHKGDVERKACKLDGKLKDVGKAKSSGRRFRGVGIECKTGKLDSKAVDDGMTEGSEYIFRGVGAE